MENNLQPSNAGQGMGIAALVLGIVGMIAAFIPCFGLIAVIFGVLAIIFGAIGLSQAKRENAPTTMPKAGLVLGITATAFVIIWVSVVLGSFGSAVMSHKDEITQAIDSVAIDSAKVKDSSDAGKIASDTLKVEETK
jgi:lysylphosphatidylglycerol synthetase-like protein (DUF2156 family)